VVGLNQLMGSNSLIFKRVFFVYYIIEYKLVYVMHFYIQTILPGLN
jgi:hypothetical protein